MSQETASPLKTGSSVRDGLLLFNEGCGSADRPADSEGRPGTIASAEEFPEPRGRVTTGSSTNGDLVRNQPEPVDLGAGKGVGGVLHGPTTRPKKHPVSHRVQHKLRSVGGDRGHSVDSLPEACCASLVLACLFCRCTELCLHLLGTLSGCARPACHSCCLDCGQCCALCHESTQDLHCHIHCHSILTGPGCESAECLEFCLECVQLCHRG